MTTRMVGSPVQRVEDERFVRGAGRYVDDVGRDALHAAVLRSPHAHARIVSIDVDAVLDCEGVHAVWTYDDLEGAMAEPLPLLIPHPDLTRGRTQHALAKDEVNHVGEAIAFVVADDRYLAEDAVARIKVDYELLPPVVGVEAARAAVHLVHDDVPGNVAARSEQSHGDAVAAIEAAPHRLSLDLEIERSASMPLEGRGVVARWDVDNGRLQVWSSTQTSTGVRAAIASRLGLDLVAVDVITPDVGGGFGVKINHPWPEELLVPLAARLLGPAGQVHRGPARALHRLGARAGPAPPRRGRVRRRGPGPGARRAVLARQRGLHAVRPDRADHHLHPAPRPLQAGRLPRAVRLALHQHRHRHALPRRRPSAGVLRHGADDGRHRGRAWATTARWCGRPTSSSPTSSPTTTVWSSRTVGSWSTTRATTRPCSRRSRRSSAGTSSVPSRPRWPLRAVRSASAWPATSRAPASAPTRARTCTSRRPGKVKVATGLTTQGQGHQTAFAQIVADELGVRFEDVEVTTGDTRRMPYAVGTFASRAAVMSGSAVHLAAKQAKAKALRIAADALEAAVDDLEIVDGVVRVRGTPGATIDLGTVAVLANPLRYAFDEASKAATQFSVGDPGRPPVAEDDEPGLEGKRLLQPPAVDVRLGDARRHRRDRPRHRRDQDPDVRRGPRLRAAGEPDDRRGPDPRGSGPGGGGGALRAHRLRRLRAAAQRVVHGLPDALRHRGAGARSTSTTWRPCRRSTRSASRAPARLG